MSKVPCLAEAEDPDNSWSTGAWLWSSSILFTLTIIFQRAAAEICPIFDLLSPHWSTSNSTETFRWNSEKIQCNQSGKSIKIWMQVGYKIKHYRIIYNPSNSNIQHSSYHINLPLKTLCWIFSFGWPVWYFRLLEPLTRRLARTPRRRTPGTWTRPRCRTRSSHIWSREDTIQPPNASHKCLPRWGHL